MSENSKIYAITTGSVTNEYLEPVIAETISVNGSSVKSLEVFAGATLSNPANRAVNNNGGTVNIAGATLTACKITGNYNGAALYMEGGTSTLTETVISENTAYRGGAFYVKGGTLTLNDALIDNNTATNLGSAIYADSAASKITVTDSTISNNKCTGTAANNGGAIFSNNANVVISISKSTFSGNTSKNSDGGAAIYNNAGTINISDTVFAAKSDTIYNKGTMNWSGKISLAGNVAIGVVSGVSKKINIADNTEISLLAADRTTDDSVIFHTSHVNLGENVTFSIGVADDQAAGIYKLVGSGDAITSVSAYSVTDPDSKVNLTVNDSVQKIGSNFIKIITDTNKNLCLQVLDSIYGAAYLNGSLKNAYTNKVISGAITVDGSSISALEIFAGATLSNPAGRSINNNGGTVEITGATLTGSAVGSYNGAALFMSGGTSALTGTVISHNAASRGGAFYVTGGTLALNDALIDNNTATGLGSALYADTAASKITIDDSTISNNKCTGTAANNGGAIFSNNANVVISISNSTFSGNTSKNSDGGAAIYNNAGTINISDTVFATKSDTIYNKGTMNWSGKISLAGNVAIGVVSGVSKKINIADNTEISLLIADRTSDDSVIFHTPHVTLGKNVSFSVGMAANQASGSYKLIGTGNAIASVSVYDIALPETSVTLTVDAAPQKFGDNYLLLNTNADNALCLQVFDAIYAITSLDGKIKEIYSDAALPSITVNGTSQDKLEIKSGASFTGSAQAVNVTNSVLDINGAVFNNITNVDVYGGIAITGQNSQMTIADTTISNTTAKSRGALQNRGAAATGSTATLTNVNFSNNQAEAAGSLGGAVFNYATNDAYTASYEQDGGKFTNNSAENGGAIYNNSIMTLKNVSFTGNKATGNGGAIYNAGVLTLTNTEFLSTTDTIYNQNALNISGTMDLRADLSGSGNVNIDNAAITVTDAIFGGTLLNLSGNNTISGGSLGFSKITFNAGAALAFTVNTDLSGITITVDGTGLEAGAVIATGVTGALGDDDSVTNMEKGYLEIVDGNLVLKVKTCKDGALKEDSTGSVYGGGNGTENDGTDITQTIASGFKQGTVFAGSQNGSDGVITTSITGGSIKKNLYGGGKVSADTTNLTIDGGEVGMSVYGGFLASKATQKISLTNSNLTIDSGTFNSNIIGGSRVDVGTTALTHEVTNVNLTLNGGNFAGVGTSTDQGTGVFSAGYVVGTKSASDTVQYYVDSCNVTVDGAALVPGVLYGGAYTSYCGYAEVGNVNITVESGSINTLVCGGWAQSNGWSKVGNIQVNINNGSVTELYAGGANADGNTEVTGMVDITISGNAAVTELFMGGKYNKSLVSGDVTVTITGDEKTFDRISGDGSHLENTGTSSLIIDTVVDVALLDGIDKLTITDGSQLNLTDADFAGLTEICFDLGDGALDTADWTAMTGVSLDQFNGVKLMVDETEMILADGVYSGSGFKVYEDEDGIKFAKLA